MDEEIDDSEDDMYIRNIMNKKDDKNNNKQKLNDNFKNNPDYTYCWKIFWEKINLLLKYLKSKKFEIILAGDFNADFKGNRKIEQKICKILNKNNMIALNTIDNIGKPYLYKNNQPLIEEKELKTRYKTKIGNDEGTNIDYFAVQENTVK